MDKSAPYTVAATAKVLGLRAQKVYELLTEGELERFEVRGHTVLVTRKSVDAARRRAARQSDG